MILYLSETDPRAKNLAALLTDYAQSEGFAVLPMKKDLMGQKTFAVMENHALTNDHYYKVGGTA